MKIDQNQIQSTGKYGAGTKIQTFGHALRAWKPRYGPYIFWKSAHISIMSQVTFWKDAFYEASVNSVSEKAPYNMARKSSQFLKRAPIYGS